MNDWETMQNQAAASLEEFPIGIRVRLCWGTKCTGTVIAKTPPFGLLDGTVKCRWDDGTESGSLHTYDIEKLT